MKGKITYVIACLAYWSGLDRLFYILNRKCKRVLTFHNVFPDSLCLEDGGGGMSVSVTQFKDMIREIGQIYAFSVDLEDERSATITFDDGFLNQYAVAAKALEEMNLPAVIFVAGDNIDRKDYMSAPAVDLLTLWLAHVPWHFIAEWWKDHGGLRPCASRIEFWIDILWPKYIQDVAGRGRNVVSECNSVYSLAKILNSLPAEYVKLRLCGITMEQLAELRSKGWHVGWHSKSHYPLSVLPKSEKYLEFSAPEVLKSFPMSYPYGTTTSVGKEDVRMCQEAGFPAAYSNFPGENKQMGRHFRMRFSVPCDKIMLHFHLSGLRYFLKTGGLLPKQPV